MNTWERRATAEVVRRIRTTPDAWRGLLLEYILESEGKFRAENERVDAAGL